MSNLWSAITDYARAFWHYRDTQTIVLDADAVTLRTITWRVVQNELSNARDEYLDKPAGYFIHADGNHAWLPIGAISYAQTTQGIVLVAEAVVLRGEVKESL